VDSFNFTKDIPQILILILIQEGYAEWIDETQTSFEWTDKWDIAYIKAIK